MYKKILKSLDKTEYEVYNSMVSKAELRSHLKRMSKKVNTVYYSNAVYCMSAEIFCTHIFYSEYTLSRFTEVFNH